jgi:hypothetical protein
MALKRAFVIVVGLAVGGLVTFGIILLLSITSNDPLLLEEFGVLNFILASTMFGGIAVIALDHALKTDLVK